MTTSRICIVLMNAGYLSRTVRRPLNGPGNITCSV